MRLRFVEADGFLSFGGRVRLDVGSGLTVVTGPNGAGKSNLGRCLDVARAVIGRAADDPAVARLGLYEDAGYEGAASFEVRLGMELDEGWERELVWQFARASYVTTLTPRVPEVPVDMLVRDSFEPLFSGSLVVRYLETSARKWSAGWEFGHNGKLFHVGLVGGRASWLEGGGFPAGSSNLGGAPFADWMAAEARSGVAQVEFAAALERLTQQPAVFSVNSPNGGVVPESVLRLSEMFGVGYENRGFSFDQVLSVVLQRGVVLTENRRSPLRRVFAVPELGNPGDLRDGEAVAAELFRLKNGPAGEQARFREIQQMFRGLTGRELEVRARPATEDEGEGLVVEPTVAGRHGERLVELSGAGIQEALVLSTLVGDAPGRVVVLDEPAVNLEPTVQRRLVGRVRGPGQFVVITHSADLVPFEQVGDLGRIVRVAQGDAGSVVFQPRFGDADSGEQLRRLKLLEPAEVRGLLFAAGVVLCEGPTETAALSRWWRGAAPGLGLPDPEAANVAVISVDGQAHFGPCLRFLDAFGVAWAVVADGPALRGDSKLASDLRELGRWPEEPEPARGDFAAWRRWWEGAGVFTVAGKFGDDGLKGGEFEAFLEGKDRDLLARARSVAGRSKPRVGAYFAIEYPVAPDEVVGLYRKIAVRLGFGDGAAAGGAVTDAVAFVADAAVP